MAAYGIGIGLLAAVAVLAVALGWKAQESIRKFRAEHHVRFTSGDASERDG